MGEFDFDELLDDVAERPASRRSKPGRLDGMQSPMQQTSTAVAAKVTGRKSRTSGKRLQVTFRIAPEFMELIRSIADEFGLSLEDAKRFVVLEGLKAWRDGARPEVTKKARNTLKIPDDL